MHRNGKWIAISNTLPMEDLLHLFDKGAFSWLTSTCTGREKPLEVEVCSSTHYLMFPHRCTAKLTHSAREVLSRQRLNCLYTLLTPMVCPPDPPSPFAYTPHVWDLHSLSLPLSHLHTQTQTETETKTQIPKIKTHIAHTNTKNMWLFSICSVSLQHTN